MARPELPPMPPPVARLLRLDLLRQQPAALPAARGDHRLDSRRPHLRGQPAPAERRVAEPADPPAAAAALAFRDLPDRLRRHDARGRAADPLGGAAADPAGAGAGGGGRAAGPRRERAAPAGGGTERGRHRGACLQHHGGAHPPLRRRPHPDAGRHRPRPAHADHPAAAARRVHGRRRAAPEDAGRPRRDGGDGGGDPGLRARRRGGRADRRGRYRRAVPHRAGRGGGCASRPGRGHRLSGAGAAGGAGPAGGDEAGHRQPGRQCAGLWLRRRGWTLAPPEAAGAPAAAGDRG